ncbi:hypothetical protein RB614_28580 [Phytohabitans sp. ZYX-F-186]|uniref:Rho termination factor N-terminal domain-containing protein n=1 Tax=Phytohabitans maris TaxID=3071409 RepID=A0ABU0ZPZ6_9ACTN|nr:hypothetical protein [Phytohabitans sp. ZYX-F-186]MDQ7908492.1 hypothetical protein [Phytohabitans sp. ZYX-F-186]
MGGREQLHDMRQRAHEAGIPGSSRMNDKELQAALRKVDKGAEPMTAKREAKGWQ